MKKIKGSKEPILNEIIRLNKTIARSKISEREMRDIETDQRFEATYYSSKFEGNKLSKDEARKAIFIE